VSATIDRPMAGEVEDRALGEPAVQGNRLVGVIPYNVESRDLGGWRERIAPGALTDADLGELVAVVEHDVTRLLGRTAAGTLRVEDRSDGLHWECDLPPTTLGSDVREMVRRGDLAACSWRMVVARDAWEGETRTVEAIGELLDVSLVTRPAYPAAATELRARGGHGRAVPTDNTEDEEAPVPETDNPTTTDTDAAAREVEDRAAETATTERPAAGLRVEDRAATTETPIETRVLDAIRSVRRGESRALTTAAAISPGELSSYLFDKLRASSVALASGVRVIATERDSVTFPALTADVAPGWYAEAGAITAGDPTLASVVATPRKLAHLVQLSNEVIDDSDPSVLDVLNAHLVAVLGLKLDLGIFEGSGTAPEIRGLANVSGIGSVSMGTNGGQVTSLDPFADALAALEAANAKPGAIVLGPRTWATVRKLKDSQGRPLVGNGSADAPPTIFGLPVHVTQLSVTETQGSASNCSSVYVYEPGQVVLVRRADVEVEVDRSRLFNSDQSEVRAKLRADLIVPNPTAVCRIVGIKP